MALESTVAAEPPDDDANFAVTVVVQHDDLATGNHSISSVSEGFSFTQDTNKNLGVGQRVPERFVTATRFTLRSNANQGSSRRRPSSVHRTGEVLPGIYLLTDKDKLDESLQAEVTLDQLRSKLGFQNQACRQSVAPMLPLGS